MDDSVQADDVSSFAPLLNDGGNSSSYKRNQNYRRRSFIHQPRKRKIFVALILVALIFLVLLIFYHCPGGDLCFSSSLVARTAETESSVTTPLQSLSKDIEAAYRDNHVMHDTPVSMVDFQAIRQDNFEFNMNGSDVMVFLHIQKTGGTTFGKHLVQDIDLNEPCKCRNVPKRNKWNKKKKKKKNKNHDLARKFRLKCECLRPGQSGEHWLFSRYNTGWKCGLHADWTELTSCVDNYLDRSEGHPAAASGRRYFYITYLRDPVTRFISEFKHVKRGATWKDSSHLCNGRPPAPDELPKCYTGDDWIDVKMDEFLECESNLAANRQTRMLADLRLVNCYNTTGMAKEERERQMLESAKENLLRMSFFGLTELQSESQYVFQDTFNLRFKVKFFQAGHHSSSATLERMTKDQMKRIEEINHLDMELYRFARELMTRRFEELKSADTDFKSHYEHLGEEEEEDDNIVKHPVNGRKKIGDVKEEDDYTY